MLSTIFIQCRPTCKIACIFVYKKNVILKNVDLTQNRIKHYVFCISIVKKSNGCTRGHGHCAGVSYGVSYVTGWYPVTTTPFGLHAPTGSKLARPQIHNPPPIPPPLSLPGRPNYGFHIGIEHLSPVTNLTMEVFLHGMTMVWLALWSGLFDTDHALTVFRLPPSMHTHRSAVCLLQAWRKNRSHCNTTSFPTLFTRSNDIKNTQVFPVDPKDRSSLSKKWWKTNHPKITLIFKDFFFNWRHSIAPRAFESRDLPRGQTRMLFHC